MGGKRPRPCPANVEKAPAKTRERMPLGICREPASIRAMKWLKNLYVQVLIGIVLGILMGCFWPTESIPLKTLGVAFVNAVKMLIAPIIFCTVVH
ncbi:MAG: C4-dicarboxylate transporter, partial [Prosthecobacter sp.]|nr:C4-dicarboxylate transporter [Prosthecobacter sp.]